MTRYKLRNRSDSLFLGWWEDRYYHVYKRIDENVFSHFALIKILNENDDTLIESWCKQKIGDRYAVHNSKLLEVWKYKMCYKTYETVSQTIQRKV